eukprot:TRINITY_DN9295_c0_g1_i2.p1 TRINITY_DN9295_c0_g1~~TRINITY_DN9295_c0_g1_i2.p1  ORF type:complete len:415 (-),score=120.51 TRINITY_DN9295_c0_g1_i2:937-2181(-)
MHQSGKSSAPGLYTAIKANNIKEAMGILRRDQRGINYKDEEGRTCVHVCAIWSSLEMLDQLRNYEAPLDVSDSHGKTPLHYAVGRSKDLLIAQRLIGLKVSINSKDNDGNTPLHCLVKEPSIDKKTMKKMLTMFIEHGGDFSLTNLAGNTVLHEAALGGNSDTTSLLLSLKNANIEINATNNQKCTPLHLAAGQGNKKICKKLLEAGADFHKIADGGTVEDVAYRNKHHEILTMIEKRMSDVRKNRPKQQIHARWDQTEIFVNLEMMIEAGRSDEFFDIVEDHRNSDLLSGKTIAIHSNQHLRTLLTVAAYHGIYHVAKYLIDKGADVNHPDQIGWTPLHAAACSSNDRVLDLLLAHPSIEVNCANSEKNTPLHYICKNGHIQRNHTILPELFDRLMARGVDLNYQNLKGEARE